MLYGGGGWQGITYFKIYSTVMRTKKVVKSTEILAVQKQLNLCFNTQGKTEPTT